MVVRFALIERTANKHLLEFAETLKQKKSRKKTNIYRWRNKMAWTKEERAAYMKNYREEHKEQLRDNQRYYRKQHGNKYKDKQKKYYQQNKEKLDAYHREYVKKHSEKIKQYRREYYKKRILQEALSS